ncbi:unnamed protein product, partial [marine sediment metagenome]
MKQLSSEMSSGLTVSRSQLRYSVDLVVMVLYQLWHPTYPLASAGQRLAGRSELLDRSVPY